MNMQRRQGRQTGAWIGFWGSIIAALISVTAQTCSPNGVDGPGPDDGPGPVSTDPSPDPPVRRVPVALGLSFQLGAANQPIGRVRLLIDNKEVGVIEGDARAGGTVSTIDIPVGEHQLGAFLEDSQAGEWRRTRDLALTVTEPVAVTIVPMLRPEARLMYTLRPLPR